jgi:MYND finger
MRFLDITCCDEEPAMLGNSRSMLRFTDSARNILLFTLLVDIDENEIGSTDCYALFYELLIEKQTFNLIRDQAAKLIDLSRDIAVWNQCPYGKFLRIVNTATLKILNECWTRYFNSESSNATHRAEFITGALKYTSLKDTEVAILTPAFGPLALDSVRLAISLAKEFWKSAAMEREKEFVNPLFVYSSGSSSKFFIHPKAHPLSGFHLASSLVQLSKDSPYYQAMSPDDSEEMIKKRVNGLARLQFSSWCKSFQKYIRSSDSLKIRFCVSDASVLCFALQQALYPNRPNPLEFYSRADAGLEFSLDGDQPPLSFNVVDTADLVDSVGLFNILVSVVPLLQRTMETTLYTNIVYSGKNNRSETELVSSLLIGDVEVIYSILGVIPWNYIHPYATEGSQHNVTIANEYLNRIAWKVLLAGDPEIRPEQAKIVFESSHLADILLRIYRGLFPFDKGDLHSRHQRQEVPYLPAQCTIRGFVVFLAFLKCHVFVNWRDMMENLLIHLESEEEKLSVRFSRRFQLLVELHLFGLLDEDRKLSHSIGIVHSRPQQRHSIRTISPVNYLVLTIPRHRLAPFHRRFLEMGRHARFGLEIALITAGLSSSIFSPTSIIFGNLILDNDGKDCAIEPDVSGWDGSSDLHVCAYVPGFILKEKPAAEDISIRCLIASDNSMQSLSDIGIILFEANPFDTDAIHSFNQLPTSKNWDQLEPSHDTHAFSDSRVQVAYPKFNPINKSFSTQIVFLQTREKQLVENQVKIWIQSLFTVGISYDSVIRDITFPFPVIECTLRTHAGCVELVAIMFSLETLRNEEYLPITPFSYDASDNVFGHVFPVVKFEFAPKLDRDRLIDSHHWVDRHLTGIFSDQEYNVLEGKSLNVPISDELFGFKSSVRSLFHHIATSKARVFEIRSSEHKTVSLILFISGLFLDQSTNSIVAEAYVPLLSSEHKLLIDDAHRNSIIIVTNHASFKYWKAMILGMSERCRYWEHDRDDCVLNHDTIPYSTEGDVCLCGVGKVPNDLEDERWAKLGPNLIRLAIGPIFTAAFIEEIRGWIEEELRCVMNKSEDTKPIDLCSRKGCSKEGNKKCARCGIVRYCSRECQVIDWKSTHKVECRMNDTQGISKVS